MLSLLLLLPLLLFFAISFSFKYTIHESDRFTQSVHIHMSQRSCVDKEKELRVFIVFIVDLSVLWWLYLCCLYAYTALLSSVCVLVFVFLLLSFDATMKRYTIV